MKSSNSRYFMFLVYILFWCVFCYFDEIIQKFDEILHRKVWEIH